jgi:hypothetical protein
MIDLLRERGANIKIFGGGGGTILPSEIESSTPTASRGSTPPTTAARSGCRG